MTAKTLPMQMKLGDALCLVAAHLRERGEPAMASTVQQAMPVVEAFPYMLEACRQAAIFCDTYADGAPGYALKCNRVGAVLEQAISKAP